MPRVTCVLLPQGHEIDALTICFPHYLHHFPWIHNITVGARSRVSYPKYFRDFTIPSSQYTATLIRRLTSGVIYHVVNIFPFYCNQRIFPLNGTEQLHKFMYQFQETIFGARKRSFVPIFVYAFSALNASTGRRMIIVPIWSSHLISFHRQ